jgi:hypothetical protein
LKVGDDGVGSCVCSGVDLPHATAIASAAPAARASSRSRWSTRNDDGPIGLNVEFLKCARDELLGARAGDDDVEAGGDPGQLQRGGYALA